MKVLAIRGRNLASLAGPFALELAAPPLGEQGLVVVTGPTGAGKSTLLDALCLALFDRTPRLGGRGAPVGFVEPVDQEELTSGDPRGLLRRGCTEGAAEVDFVGTDGRRWRASWSVRRARGRRDGRLQPATLTLTDLDSGERAGGTKVETLAAIEGALGLDFDAFRKAALLAQGEFAEFLRARPAERAALLERVTGTALYGELSVQAHRRAADEQRALELLEAEKAGLAPLTAAERSGLVSDGALAEASATASRRLVERAERSARWSREAVRLQARVAEAAAEEAAAARASLAAQARREVLRRAERADALRAPLLALDLATVEATRSAGERDARAAEAGAAARAEAATAAEVEAAHEARRAAEAERAAAAPALAEARALDLAVARANPELLAAEHRARSAHAAAASARAEAQRLSRARDEAAARRDAAAAWLAERPGLAPLVARWPRWEALLERLVALAEETARRAAERPALAEAAVVAEAALASAAANAAVAEQAAARARAAEEEAAALVARAGFDAAGWAARLDLLRALDAALGRARDLATIEASAMERARAASARSAAARAEVDAAAARARALEAPLAEAERALALFRAAVDLADRRPELVAHEPCPLCGAREHPWAPASSGDAQEARFGALVEAQVARVAQVRAELAAADRQAAAALATGRAAADELRAASAEAVRAADDRLSVSSDAVAQATRLGLTPELALELGPGEGESGADLAAALERLTPALVAERARAEAGLAEAEVAARALGQAREATRAREVTREAARRALALAEREAHATGDRLAASERARADAEREARAALDALAPAFEASGPTAHDPPSEAELFPLFADPAAPPAPAAPSAAPAAWREALGADAASMAAFLAARRAEVEGFARAERELHEAGLVVHGAAAASAEARARAEERAVAAALADDERATRSAERDAALAARGALLGGRPADEVEATLEASARAAAARVADAVAAAAATAARVEASRARLDDATASAARADEALRAARAALADALRGGRPGGQAPGQDETLLAGASGLEPEADEEPLDEAEARALLARGDAWRREERAALEALARRLELAVRQLALARALLTEHAAEQVERGAGPAAEQLDPAVAAARADAAAARARDALRSAEARAASLRARREADDLVRGRAAALAPRLIEQARRAATWRAVAAAIGSHDGRKLRLFAQSLSLDLLLERANGHLRRLAPRYALRRVRNQDLDLEVVDRDLGGEVRAVSSLSGGETFLASLALALGLSSLAAAGARVETLFVDEGFGALDPISQEQALAALDALQADGRQVVLVSHVPGVAERAGAGVRIVPQGEGRSLVEVDGLVGVA